jgi:hypothetical protein
MSERRPGGEKKNAYPWRGVGGLLTAPAIAFTGNPVLLFTFSSKSLIEV